jgi:hypothetical protein
VISNRTNKTQDVAQLRGRSPGANQITSVYERLKNLQITLPDVPPPVVDGYVAAFVPFVRTGNLIHLSGRLAKRNGKLWCGKLGEEITTAEGQSKRVRPADFLSTNQMISESGPLGSELFAEMTRNSADSVSRTGFISDSEGTGRRGRRGEHRRW